MFKKPKGTTLPGMNQETLSQEAETLPGSRSRKKRKSDPFCAGASPERLHVQREIPAGSALCRPDGNLSCWLRSADQTRPLEDQRTEGPQSYHPVVTASSLRCYVRIEQTSRGLYLSKMRSISIRLEENPPWMAGLDSPDNSRCQETTVSVGTRLFPQRATSSQAKDQTTNGLCGV